MSEDQITNTTDLYTCLNYVVQHTQRKITKDEIRHELEEVLKTVF